LVYIEKGGQSDLQWPRHQPKGKTMKHSNRTLLSTIAFSLLILLSTPISSYARQSNSTVDDLIEGITRDVIDRVSKAASDEVRRNTGIDPLKRGYHPHRNYEPVSGNTNEETRRELQKLNEEHDRKINKLNEELQRTLDKASEEFRREAAKEDKPEKVNEKRKILHEKVNRAYSKFEQKVAEENNRFDEKREKILSKR